MTRDTILFAARIENDLRRDFARMVDTERKHRGWSIRKMAAELGTSVSQVQRLLHREVGGSLTLRTVTRAVQALGISAHVYLRAEGARIPARAASVTAE